MERKDGQRMSTNLFDTEGITRSERILHTPSGFAKKNLSYIQEVGRLKSLKTHSSIRENLESYLLFLILDGEGSVVYQDHTYPVRKGELVFLDCRMHYEHKSSEEHPWELLWVHFNGSLPQACYPIFFEKNSKSPVLRPKTGLQSYQEIVERLMEQQKERELLAEMRSSQELSELMMACIGDAVQNAAANAPVGEPCHGADGGLLRKEDFEGIREYINEHFGDAGMESALAIQYGVGQQELSQAFEKKYGIPLNAYIANRKFNKAKELLRFTIKPVEEIVVESGIGNEDTFRQLFLDNEEMTPEEYRRKWAQWIKCE